MSQFYVIFAICEPLAHTLSTLWSTAVSQIWKHWQTSWSFSISIWDILLDESVVQSVCLVRFVRLNLRSNLQWWIVINTNGSRLYCLWLWFLNKCTYIHLCVTIQSAILASFRIIIIRISMFKVLRVLMYMINIINHDFC